MGTIFSGDPTDGMTERDINISQSDFGEAPASGEEIAAGEVEEVGRAEIGEDGQFVSYELVRPGRELGETGRSAEGKAFIQLRDSDGNPVDSATEVRLTGRPINKDFRDELSGWKQQRDLNVDEPDQRMEWPPATGSDGDEEVPEFIRHGRILALEVRHPSDDVEVDLTQSEISIPGKAYY